MPEDDIECKPFTIISIDSLLVYDKKILSASKYLDNFAYNIVNNEMADYLDQNVFED